MKGKGVEPNLVIYNSLLAAAADDASWLDAWAILDDMLLNGIKPNAMSFNHLLHAVRFKNSHFLSRVLSRMEACGLKQNAQTVSHTIARHVAEGNLEMAVRHLLSVSKTGVVPTHQTVQSVIIFAARNNFARLALDLATWFEWLSNRRLEESVWVNCLIASAETAYAEGIERCWGIVTKEFKTLLDEGICVAVMNTAARHGLPALATEALQMLQTINISPQEHHFAAIVEAFCRKGEVKEAVLVLGLMSSSGIIPSIETADPIAEHIQENVTKIDEAWTILEQLREEGRHIDFVLPQAVIKAAVTYGDLSRAHAFSQALPSLGLAPGAEIYNSLLQGCIQTGNRQLGDTVLADMKNVKVRPNQDTYESVIQLCLTQSVYEDAFFYLEEMKAAGHKPPPSIYTAIIEKCLSSNDARHRIALEEMEACGYGIPSTLKRQLGAERQDTTAPSPTQSRLSEDERRFINKGGLV
ncbi:hypothetical protein AN958_02687 [Leucoagaricus sp. SymC.cos]|nr:hypothetical protein AN958_02687 [Leucoagaricus sp. SymC.cos]